MDSVKNKITYNLHKKSIETKIVIPSGRELIFG